MVDETGLVKADTVELGTLRASTAGDMVREATGIATALAAVIESQKLFSKISGRRYVRVEGWLTLLALLGVVPREVANEETDDGGFVATVELVRMADGFVVGRATAECGMDEQRWNSGPRYARRSMAATRATGKAARLGFSWIVALAGFEGTPFEEMPVQNGNSKPAVVVPSKLTAGDMNEAADLFADVPTKAAEGGGEQSVYTTVHEIMKKTGGADGKEWTLYGIKCGDGKTYGTFNHDIADAASTAIKSEEPVNVWWVPNKKYPDSRDVVGIEPGPAK